MKHLTPTKPAKRERVKTFSEDEYLINIKAESDCFSVDQTIIRIKVTRETPEDWIGKIVGMETLPPFQFPKYAYKQLR